MAKIVLGYAPTRRSIFSAPDAVKYADLTREKLRSMGVEFVDIDDISQDGLLHDDGDRIRIAEKFRERKVDGLFFPHGNFGTEYEVPGTRGRMKRGCASETVSAACLPQGRCFGDSGCPSPIYATAGWRIRNSRRASAISWRYAM